MLLSWPKRGTVPLSYHASVLAKKRYNTPIVPCFCLGQKEVQYPYRTMLLSWPKRGTVPLSYYASVLAKMRYSTPIVPCLSWPKRGTVPLSYHASVLAKKRYSTPISYNAPLYTWFCPCYCELAPYSVYDGVYYIPLGRFSMVDVSTVVGIVSVPKWSAFETSRRELSEDISFGIGILLVVGQSTLQNRPRGV